MQGSFTVGVAIVLMGSHVMRQQLMHLDPILFFTVCFFGVKMAIIASSKTVFSPFCVKAEHST